MSPVTPHILTWCAEEPNIILFRAVRVLGNCFPMIPQRNRAAFQTPRIDFTRAHTHTKMIKLAFQCNLPLCWAPGRAEIWDKLDSLCRAVRTAFLKSWVNIKHKRKYQPGSSELPLSPQPSSNEVIRESSADACHHGSVQSPATVYPAGVSPAPAAPRVHTPEGEGGRKVTRFAPPSYSHYLDRPLPSA